MKKVIVIGGGPAGMMAAGTAGKNGNKVILIEKNNRLGRKLFITGKGRCNVTNATDSEGLIANTPGNPYFLYSAFYSFDSQATMAFFEELGVKLKVERGNRVFPVSDKSGDIVRAMEKFLRINNVEVMLDTTVNSILKEGDTIKGVSTNNGDIMADSVIVATGGISYPMTGSTGDGHKFARSMGRCVTQLRPSLVPLKIKEKWCSELMGLSLKNVSITAFVDNKEVYSDFGEMMFTHFGVTGPIVLSTSRHILNSLDKTPKLVIDLKPALNAKELDNRLLRDFTKYINKDFKNALDDLLPQRLIPVVIKLSGINPEKKVNSISKDERKKILEILKGLTLHVIGTTGFDEAVVTAGGVEVDEIDPSTMASKVTKGLYFAGEVIDVDSFTGGFNLQIAFSTGFLAGTNC